MTSSQPVPLDPESQLAAKLLEIEERLRALETAPRITSTSQRGGSYQLLDDDGNLVWTFGEYTRGLVTDYGIQSRVPDGSGGYTTSLEINGGGMEAPHIPLQFTKSNDFVAITSGSFTTVWIGYASLLVSDTLLWRSVCSCDAATTGEAKLIAVGELETDVISLAASAFTNTYWDWLHGYPQGSSFSVSLQVRRTSGAGNVNVYAPSIVSQAGSAGTVSTPGGL